MANAFKCDSCGGYRDGEPAIITLHPNSLYEKALRYDLCPVCFNDVVNVIVKDDVRGDID